MINKSHVLEMLRKGEIDLPPLQIAVEAVKVTVGTSAEGLLDAIIRVTWQGRAYRFAAEIRQQSTPKVLQQAIQLILFTAQQAGLRPMIVAPYLSEAQLVGLEKLGVSGIDLSGNGLVVVPDELLVLRSGAPNRFPSTRPIKNIYRKSSSMVPRVFLLRQRFGSVTEIQAEIRKRGGRLALSTVSKALAGLEDDMLVARDAQGIRTIQPEVILEKLVDNFEQPRVLRRIRGRAPSDDILREAARAAESVSLPLVVTGAGSINRYSAMAREPITSVYCPEIDPIRNVLQVEETSVFANVELLETDDDLVYFDARLDENGCSWSSPLQTYVETSKGEQRLRQASQQVRECILAELREHGGQL